jgi:hypothetical protein
MVNHGPELCVGEPLSHLPQFVEQHGELHLVEYRVAVRIDESEAAGVGMVRDEDFVESLMPPCLPSSLAALILDLHAEPHTASVAG